MRLSNMSLPLVAGQLMQRVWPAGAIRAPRYIYGSTTNTEWVNTVRNAPAPWGELETKKIIISTQRSALRALDSPQTPAAYWDKVGVAALSVLSCFMLDPAVASGS
jgi:hypothetical protein